MEKAKIRPLATPKPLNRSSQKLAAVITSWTAPGMQNFVAIGSGVSVPQIRDFAVLLWWLVFCSFFLVSSIRLQHTPLDGYLRKIRQMTSFWVRKCLLGVSMTIFYIWTLKFPKTAICSLHNGKRYFLPITWLNLHRSAVKVRKWIGKLGSGISKIWTIFSRG